MGIIFYGDPHGEFGPLREAVARERPDHVVVLGDLELARSFREEFRDLMASGIGCWWILGNHDSDTGERLDLLAGDYPEGDLGGRAVDLACRGGVVRVAGLGGVYKGKVWYPKQGLEPRHLTRADFMRSIPHHARWRGGLPLRQRDTIFPEDHAALARFRADVLVTHEAPSSHEHGTTAIDDLARDMRARLVVHGHMHKSYAGRTSHGAPVRGVDGRECFRLSPLDLG